jgi:hypothetical protein
LKLRKSFIKPPEYNKLFDGNLENQLEISKHFLENMKIKKKTKSSKKIETRII